MPITSGDILAFLYIVVGVMLIVVLYHIMFVVVDLRKILKRFENITEEVEAVILKPIAMADQLLQWLMEHMESKKKAHHTVVDHKDKDHE